MQKQWGVPGNWNPRSNPVSAGPDRRYTVSRHNGTPIVESYNRLYDYWVKERDMTLMEVMEHFGQGYVGNM